MTRDRPLARVGGSQSIQSVAVPEPQGRSRLAKHSAKDRVVFVWMGLVNVLPDGVSSRPPGLEVVLVTEGGPELIELEIGDGVPDIKCLADSIQ